MALRDPLVKMEPGDTLEGYLSRCLAVAAEETGHMVPRIRVELTYNLFGAEGPETERHGIALWVERGTSARSESWQKLSVSIYGGYEALLTALANRMTDFMVNQ